MESVSMFRRTGSPTKLNSAQQDHAPQDDLIKAFSPGSGPAGKHHAGTPKIVELLPMDQLTRSLKCTVPTEVPIFDPLPPLISFSEYEGHCTYTATLALRNKDTVARRVKVISPDTPFFRVRMKPQSSKVAAGMEAICTVTFCPAENEDYEHDLVVCTEREKFIVPIRAQGARAMLNLPASIAFGETCPCRSTSSRTVLVSNIGKCSSAFSLMASPPFTVAPQRAFLNVGETLQLQVHLTPVSVGEVRGSLTLQFDNGSHSTACLYGQSVEIDVAVTPTDVQFVGTFVTKTTLQYFHVINRTSQPIKFALKKFATPVEDGQEHELLADGTASTDNVWRASQPDVFGTRAMSAFPRESVVYPGTQMEVTVEFSPYVARKFTETCYVELEGHAERQPVVLTGLGLGPCAIFTYDVLDIGNAYINTLYRYSVQLENRGDIPAPFAIQPGDGEFGSMFTFVPSDGVVPAETTLDIEVELLASHIGRLEERVLVDVAGIDSPLSLQFKGRIVGPTFDIDVATLDFGMVAYGFRYCKNWTVYNTSEIPMQFSWRVDNEALPADEFNIIPCTGAILPGVHQQFLVEFIPRNVAKYDSQIILDVPKVKSGAVSIAATGECVVPRLSMSHEVLDFGDCFLHHPYTLGMVISNDAKLPVKFEIEPQDEISVALAGFTADPSNGGVAAQGEQVVNFTLLTRRLGQIKLPCKVHAIGSALTPTEFILAAKSIGPTITCKNPDGSLCTAIAFGKISVLHAHEHVLSLHNESLIPAHITALITSSSSVFSVDCHQCVLEAGESRTVTVAVQPDETFTFSDTLHILAASGTDLEIPVSATGTGSTLYCEQAEDNKLDFRYQLAGTAFSRKVVIENHGRRTCTGVWQNMENEQIKKKWGKSLRGPTGKPDFTQIPAAERAVFSVQPEKAVIPPKQCLEFVIHGVTPTTGFKEECLQLITGGGEGGKAMLSLTAVASFAVPQLKFSARTLLFEYFYHPLMERPPEKVELAVANDGMVPLHASLKSQAPFDVMPQSLHLEPGSSSHVTVTMNHTYRKDLQSHKPKKKLVISFADNPHYDALDLDGSINYPNVKLSSERISFGSTLKDTFKSEVLTITNTSAVPVKYFWDLHNDASFEEVDVSQIFDIKPVEGYLMPGEEDAARVTYFAKGGPQVSATAVLQVLGGPDTLVSLKAMPNHMAFSLEPKNIVLGACLYDKVSYKEVTLVNTSKVQFDWKYNGSSLKRSGSVLCTPTTGTLASGTKQVLNLKITAGVPNRVNEVVYFEVAHFEPVAVTIQVDGIYSFVALSIPRLPPSNTPEKLAAAADTLLNKGSMLLDMIAQRDHKVLKRIKEAGQAPVKGPMVPQLNGSELFGHVKMYSDKITQLEVEAEADRTHVCEMLIHEETAEHAAHGSQQEEEDKSTAKAVVPQRLMKFTKVLGKYSSKPLVAAGEYVLDFGSVVKGTQVTKNVRVQNISTYATVISIDKALLEAYGFVMKPDKLAKLPGLPEVTCLDIGLCLNTNMSHVVPGKIDFHVPVQVQSSPPVIINVRADIATPEVTCSQQTFQFGRVAYGLAKVIMLRLHNSKKVPAEWTVKKPTETGADVDWQYFCCVPDSGTLGSGHSVSVRVVFLPDHPSKHGEEYKQDLHIRLANNSKPTVMSATGTGYIQRIKVAPKTVDMGAVLPGSGQIATREFKIKNPGQFPVEVVALDFDEQHIEEERMLAAWDGYSEEHGYALEVARPPGGDFWEHIRAHHQKLEAENLAAEEKEKEQQEALDTSDEPPEMNDGAITATPSDDVAILAEEAAKEECVQSHILPPASETARPFIAAVCCFESDTEAQQAELLSQRYQVPCTTLTDLVLDAGELEDADDSDPTGRSFGDMLYDTLIGWDHEQIEHADASKQLASRPYERLSPAEVSTLLGRAFKLITQQPKFSNGFVLKGCQCEFAEPLVAMQQLLAALDISKATTGASEEALPLWEGRNTLWFADMQLSVHTAQERHMQNLSEEEKEAAQQRIAEVEAKRAAAALAATTPPKGKKASARKGAAEVVEAPQFPPGIDPKFGALFGKYSQQKQGVESYLKTTEQDPCVKMHCIPMTAEQVSCDDVHLLVVGTKFVLDVLHNVMPRVEADKTRVAPPFFLHVLRKPGPRKPNPSAAHFTLMDAISSDSTGTAAAQDSAGEVVGSRSRWILQPGQTKTVCVQFKSDDVLDATAKLQLQAYTGEDKVDVTVRASCAYPQICVDPKLLFAKSKKIKVGQEDIQFKQCYIPSRSRFQFGAVLAGVTVPEDLRDIHSDHTAMLKVQNNGRFDARVSFAIKSVKVSQEAAEDAAGAKGGKGKKGAPVVSAAESCFSVLPSVLEIPQGETASAKLLCFPTELGELHDAVICTVDENPEPVEYAVMATGEEAQVSIVCEGQAETVRETPAATPAAGKGKTPTPPKGAKHPPPPLDGNTGKICFERLLPGRKSVKYFTVTNKSRLPVHWLCPNTETLPEEFKMFDKDDKGKFQPLSVVGGLLSPGEAKSVHVEFSAAALQQLNDGQDFSKPVKHSLNIMIQDEKRLRPQVLAHTVLLEAETYQIDASISYPDDEQLLNFGSVKVQSEIEKKFTIKNTGPYPVSYEAVLQDKAQSFFTIHPATDEVAAYAHKEVTVIFKGKNVMKELKMTKSTSLIQMLIREPMTACTEKSLSLKLGISAVFSKFCITPAKGISFQPTTYNTQSAPRSIELANTGVFPFQFKLLNLNGEAEPTRPDSKEGKGKAAKGKGDAVAALQVGAFSVSPMQGTVAAGSSAQIQVIFDASGNQVHNQQLGIDVEDRSPEIHPNGLPLELTGESCIPGINADDVEGIFEEHAIKKEMDPSSCTHGTVYGVTDKVFSFGNVLADLAGAGDEACCIRAQLKFTNATKVASTVHFSITPDSNDNPYIPYPLSVAPKSVEVAPHEYQFIALTFHPRQIVPYSATFQAKVENGDGRPETQIFTCSIQGNGIVPSVAVVQPTKVDSCGRVSLVFPRRMPGKVSRQSFEVKNNGTIEAHARLELPADSPFSIEGSHNLSLAPYSGASIPVTFHPDQVGNHNAELLLHVSQNPYEHIVIQLAGECSQGDIEFVVDDVETDTVHFPDSFIGSDSELLVHVYNYSANHFKVQWPTHANIAVEPAVFHAHAQRVTPVRLRLCSTDTIVLPPAELAVSVSQVKYPDEPIEWSQGQLEEDGVTAVPEPKFEIVKGSEKRLTLKVHALVDDCRYDCTTKDIVFSRTMMFQARSEVVTVRNTGQTQVSYNTRILGSNGFVDVSSPFTVSPESGSVKAGGEEELTIRFCPVDVFAGQHLLCVDFPCLAQGLQPLEITLAGGVVRPWCHMEVPSSEYLTGGNRKPSPGCIKHPPILDPDTTVIEIKSLGQGITNHKRFHVLNPTNVAYEFHWELAGGSAVGNSQFRCYTSKGIISAGRRYEMAFEFLPHSTDVQESLWSFSIPAQGLHVLVLLVGSVVEPNIAFSQSSVNFRRVLLGRGQKEVLELVNSESMPFDFSFDKETYEATDQFLRGSGKGPAVRFEPDQGTLRPNSSTRITVVYRPRAEVPVNYTAVCHVKHKPTPLTLNVKGEGYAVHEELHLQAADGSEIPMSCRAANSVDLGNVHLHEKVVRSFQLANQGSIPVEFEWEIEGEEPISVTPKSGQVSVGDRKPMELCYHPTTAQTLKDFKVLCKICSGKTYTFKLDATSHRPAIHRSWISHNFGRVYVHPEGAEPHRKTLTLRNDDTQTLSVSISIAKPEVQADAAQLTLEPGTSVNCNLAFAPQAVGKFRCPVCFEVNGIFKTSAEVVADIIPRRLEVASNAHRIVDLGALRTGKSRKFSIEVLNKALLNAEINLEPSKDLARRLGLHMHIDKAQLGAREKSMLTITYKPKARLIPFNEAISVMVSGVVLPLLRVKGSALGLEAKLSAETLPFGNVMLGSSTTKALQLHNLGDVGFKFSWQAEKLAPHMSLVPTSGFLAPGQHVKVTVSLQPKGACADIRVDDLQCHIEGMQEPLHLGLSGSASETTQVESTMTFQCRVRESMAQTIVLKNPSSQHWTLKPKIDNSVWSGMELVMVPAYETVDYMVVYKPLNKTKEEGDGGTIFFPIPDGSGILYKLQGTSTDPAPVTVLQREITARQKHTESLSVCNWLNKGQLLVTSVEIEGEMEKSLTVAVPPHLDIPALADKPCKLSLTAHKPGKCSLSVYFKNKATGEYVFYKLELDVKEAGPVDTVVLATPVRCKASRDIRLKNPLGVKLTLTGSCTTPIVSFPAQVDLEPYGEAVIGVGYMPLLVSEQEALLTYACTELGQYQYTLNLVGQKGPVEATIKFKVPLGGSETKVFHFTNMYPDKCDYASSISQDGATAFSCAPSVSALGAGKSVEVPVTFQPANIGETHSTLTLNSPIGGECTCVLHGVAAEPTPQGPVKVTGSATIPFMNPFMQDCDFSYSCNNPAFAIKADTKVKARAKINITVSVANSKDAGKDAAKNSSSSKQSKHAMLTIACPMTTCKWCYYLEQC